jgi:cephalosporin hydroxylase
MPAFDTASLIRSYELYTNELNVELDELKRIIVAAGEPLEGNSFYGHQTLQLYPALFTKQVNLFWCGLEAKTRLCEIGFNAGHSALLFLIGRQASPLEMTVFDIGEHRYTKPCLSHIQSRFPSVRFEYVEGDSTATMPAWIDRNAAAVGAYDVVHVDGGHTEHCITNDMKNADRLVRPGGLVIVDDTNCAHINRCADSYIASGAYTEVDVLKTEGYQHRILRKV